MVIPSPQARDPWKGGVRGPFTVTLRIPRYVLDDNGSLRERERKRLLHELANGLPTNRRRLERHGRQRLGYRVHEFLARGLEDLERPDVHPPVRPNNELRHHFTLDPRFSQRVR